MKIEEILRNKGHDVVTIAESRSVLAAAHTGIIQPSDFDQAVELLVQVLRRLDRGTVGELASFR